MLIDDRPSATNVADERLLMWSLTVDVVIDC